MLSTLIKDFPLTLDEIVKWAETHYPEKNAVLTNSTKTSFKLLDNQVNCFCKYLSEKGIGKGDKVAIILPNSLNFVVALFAVFRVGAIATLLNPQLKKRELESVVESFPLNMIISDFRGYENFDNIFSAVEKERIILFNDYVHNTDSVNVYDINTDIEEVESCVCPCIDIDPAIIIFSSGTQGDSKGIILSHKNVLSNVISNIKSIGITDSDKTIIFLPLTHMYALGHQLLSSFIVGGSVFLMEEVLIPQLLYQYINKYEITWFAGTPTIFYLLLRYEKSRKKIKDTNELKIKMFTIGAGAISEWAITSLKKMFPKTEILITYGLTENAPRVSTLLSDDVLNNSGSVGKPLRNVEVKINDEELIVRGSSVMLGYVDKYGKVSKVTGNSIATGDIGRITKEGYIEILGRKKKIIKSSGYVVNPCEVEKVINSYPGVLKSFVFGSPDNKYGEIVNAEIIISEDLDIVETDLLHYLKFNLSKYKMPKLITFNKKPVINNNYKFSKAK